MQCQCSVGLTWLRSAFTARSQVWLVFLTVASIQEVAPQITAAGNVSKEPQTSLSDHMGWWERGWHPVVALTSTFVTWRVYGILRILRSAHVSNALCVYIHCYYSLTMSFVNALNSWDAFQHCAVSSLRARTCPCVKPNFLEFSVSSWMQFLMLQVADTGLNKGWTYVYRFGSFFVMKLQKCEHIPLFHCLDLDQMYVEQ